MELKRVAGVDVGGTFTDIAFWDDKHNTVILRKVLTTPQDATEGIISGIRALPEWPQAIVHGTTLVINALIQRRGALIGLITTQGYRDILEMGRELRYDAFDLFLKIPEPLVPRSRRLEVKERIGANGDIVSPLDEDGVRSAARQLKEMGVEAVAVAFVNAYRNPIHELRAVVILREELPNTFVCSSAAIAPELREYERFSTVAANAYVMPLVSRYLERLLHAAKAPVFVMLSDGGIATARTAMQIPINLVESGPAAGA
ncbi:MAG: hydantoinase/oxoprolinase family protein, partial [Betaproteobacteria bacterium]|nr:hydantoinase/oxoprolinase family protein [Betaproteobacteria bacterium]